MSDHDSTAPRAVIDTNVLLDWLVFRAPAALTLGDAVMRRQWIWCATPAMLDELRAVLSRSFGERWELAQKLALTINVSGFVAVRPTAGPVAPRNAMVCRDAADQMFIDLALDCRPCWLITRDRALLALRRRASGHGVAIATPELWQRDSGSAPTDTATARA